MSSAAQLLANQLNAQRSTGPVTPEGKARISRNAKKLGLFSAVNFVAPEEQELFQEFSAAYIADLSPEAAIEQTLAREIVHAAWRLRRCANIESRILDQGQEGALGGPLCAGEEGELERIQISVDRARAAAQRSFHRALAELRRVQTERVYRTIALPPGFDAQRLGQASCIRIDPAAILIKQASVADATERNAIIERYREATAPGRPIAAEPAIARSAKQSQLPPAGVASVPRNAPCPCGSREKYKRCCGRNAPPVLSGTAA